MSRNRQLSVQFPAGGLNKKQGFQTQPQFTTSDAQNVWPEDISTGRARGGRRPGLKKRLTTMLPDAIRMLAVINLAQESGYKEQLVCSAGGQLYRHNDDDDTWTLEASSLPIATDRLVLATPFEQKLIIADWGIVSSGSAMTTTGTATIVVDQLDADTDGEVDVDGVTFTNTGGTDFDALGVEAGTHVVRIRSGGGTPGAYEISDVDGSTITLATSPGTSLSGLTFEVNVDLETAGVLATAHRLLVRPTGAGTAGQYTISLVDQDEVTLGSAPAGTDTGGIHFQFHRTPKVWDLVEETVSVLTATDGTVPLGCNIVTTHSNRIWFAGDTNNPNAWYASRAGDETDWAYGEPDANSAVAGNEFRAGQIGEPITALIPHNEECMVVGANDSFYVIRGDIGSGGYITRINSKVGPISPNAWCRTTTDELVMLTRDGLYTMPNGCGENPQAVSRQTVPYELLNVSTERYLPLLAFDHTQGAVHVYLTPQITTFYQASPATVEADGVSIKNLSSTFTHLDAGWIATINGGSYRVASYSAGTVVLADAYPTPPYTGTIAFTAPPSIAYWVDWRRSLSNGFDKPVWPMRLGDTLAMPSAITEYAPFSTSRIAPVVIGSQDGRTLVFDRNESTDDEDEFDAFVVCGPIRVSANPDQEAIVTSGRVVAALGLQNFRWTVHTGETAEQAQPGYVGLDDTWSSETFNADADREYICLAGHAMTIKVEDRETVGPWSFEEFVMSIESQGILR